MLNTHQPKTSPSPSVGARVVERCGGRHLGDGVQAFLVARSPCRALPTQPTRATRKAHSTSPLPTRPYGSRGLLPVSLAAPYLRLMPLGRPLRSPSGAGRTGWLPRAVASII